MAWLAITWNNDRLLFLTARGAGSSLTFDRAFSVELEQESDSLIREKVRETVLKERLGKSDVILVLPRGGVEIRSMSFPYVPVEELPDLVRFQAGREFNGYDPASPLDFLLLHERAGGSGSSTVAVPVLGRNVLATAIPSAMLGKWTALCQSCQLKLRRIVLRPCETASLWCRSPFFREASTDLLVELDSEEASQVVIHRGQPIFMRSPRLMSALPEEGSASGIVFSQDETQEKDDPSAPLIAELKRTRFAVRNETPPVPLDSIVLCGTGTDFSRSAARIKEAMDAPVTLFDPWADISRTGDLRAALPSHAEQYAPLLGAVLLAANGFPSELDLANPKRKPVSGVRRKRLFAALGATAALLLLAAIVFGYLRRSHLEAEIKQLGQRQADLKKEEQEAKKLRAQLTALDHWSDLKIDWFEQLHWLSAHLPEAREVKLTSLNFNAAGGGAAGGRATVPANIELKGLARNEGVFGPMEQKLRDATHNNRSGAKKEDKSESDYRFSFDMTVFIDPKAETGQ